MIRKDWTTLDGTWDFSFDQPTFDRKILVPFAYQSAKSGIGDRTDHPTVWYRRTFQADPDKLAAGKHLILHFGAVDSEAEVWVNDRHVGGHTGGYTPFEMDITEALQEGENILTLRADDSLAADKPRGKQSWSGDNFACWYTPSTGIWQSVWLEYTGAVRVKQVKITPDLAHNTALCEVYLSAEADVMASVETMTNSVLIEKQLPLGGSSFFCEKGYGRCTLTFPDLDVRRVGLVWSLQCPNLIDVTVKLSRAGKQLDEVSTYFGMRSVSVRDGRVYLNDEVLYERLVLDQGYWPESLLTAPDAQAYIDDLMHVKVMGLNGVRMHQKIEDPRFYYAADRMGVLVWGEMPSCYRYTDNTVRRTADELTEFIARDYNHPSIITWVPANETWGFRGAKTDPQRQHYSDMLIYLAKALDPTRLVSGNDGWEQTQNTDLIGIHDYALMPSTMHKYDNMAAILTANAEVRAVMADGQAYAGQPVLMTEYGGIAFSDGNEGWGYYDKVRNEEEFLARLAPITEYLIQSGHFAGFCYTQLTDVMQEKNGLLTEDRKMKVPEQKLAAIFGRKEWEESK